MQDARVMPRARAAVVPVATVELATVALLVAAGTVSTRALPIGVAIAVLFWPARWIATRQLSVNTPGDIAAGWLVAMLLVTLWATALPAVTQPQVWRLALGIALYYAVANWAGTVGRLRFLSLALAGIGLALALGAPVTVQWFGPVKLQFIPEAIYRPLPLLLADPIHPNVMAGALVLLLPLVLSPLLFEWHKCRRDGRLWFGLTGLVMAGVLVLTKSRGGLLGFAASLAVLAALRWRAGSLVMAGIPVASGLVVWRLGLSRVVEALAAAQATGGLDGRLEVWSRAIYMTQDFPFTGIGMGTFKPVANAMYPFFLAGPDADIAHAHNLYLQIAVDLGMPALVAWLALFGLVCVAAWRVYRWGRGGRTGCHASSFMTALGAGLLASQVALAVHGLLDATTWGTRPAVAVWAVWGLAMAAAAITTRPVESNLPANEVNITVTPEESWN